MNFIFILLLLVSTGCFAQPDPLGEFNKHVIANWNGEYQRIGPYKVKGSSFLFGDSYPGSITYKSGKIARDKMVYFDIYYYKVGTIEKNIKYDAAEEVQEFTVQLPEQYGGKELKFRNANAFGASASKGFFNILEDGKKVALVKYFKVNLMIDQGSELNKDTRVFEQVYEYYIYDKALNELHRIKLKEKDIAKALNNKKFMDEVIHAKKIDLSYEGSVISAISLYNDY